MSTAHATHDSQARKHWGRPTARSPNPYCCIYLRFVGVVYFVYMEGFIIRGLDRVVPGREGTKSPPRTLCRGTITNRFKKLSLVTQTPMLCLSRQITSRRLSRAMRSTDLCLGLIHVLYLRHCSSFRDNLLEIRVGQFLGKTSY